MTTAERNYNTICRGAVFPQHLVRNMRRLATIRNKLIHERTCHRIDNKQGFVQTFGSSHLELQQLAVNMNAARNAQPQPYRQQEDCIIL